MGVKVKAIMVCTVVKRKTVLIITAIVLCVIVVVGAVVSAVSIEAFNKSKRLLPIYSVGREDKAVAISFDCAWGVDYTDKLLSVMEEEKVKCTFFCVEFWTTKYPEYVKKISDKGHEIGTHSATHPHMNGLNEQAVKKELETSKNEIEKITGKKVELFRPPFGEYNDRVISVAKSLGLYVIQWDVDSLDWKNLSAKEIEKRVIERVKEGSIVLFHNQGLHTHEALKNVIKTLKEKGYTFYTIGELIYRDNYVIDGNGKQIKGNQ